MIKNVDISTVLTAVFEKDNYAFIKNQIECSDEVYIRNNVVKAVVFANGRNLADNIYTNPKKSKWLGVFDDEDNLIGLQLIEIIGKEIQLIVGEKRKSAKYNFFGQIINYIKETYSPELIYTFPFNDKLKEYYMSYGFVEDGNSLIMNL
jgi:hypothetical protein